MSTKSNKINWYNNSGRQWHLVDCALATILGAYLVLLAAFWFLNVDDQAVLFWSVSTMILSTSIIALFGVVQVAFTVVPLVAAYARNR